MKTQLLLLPIFICTAAWVVAQNKRPVTCTILDVTTHVSNDLIKRLDPQSANFQTSKEHRQCFDRLQRGLTWTAVHAVCRNWKNQFPYQLNDVETLNDCLRYNRFGLPDPIVPKKSLKKVLAKDDTSTAFLLIQVNCQIEEDAITIARLIKQVKPKVEISIKAIDRNGKTIEKGVARSVYEEFIRAEEFEPEGFENTSLAHIDELQRMLDSLIGRTAIRAMKNMTLEL